VAAALPNRTSRYEGEKIDGGRERFMSLTQREKEILDLIALGKSNAEVARFLSIKERTVKNHLHNAYAKLDLKGRYEAINLKLRYLQSEYPLE
jgi:DNA-binding CsgD family transcriptional regulator